MSATLRMAKPLAFALLLTLATYAGGGRILLATLPGWQDAIVARASDQLGTRLSVGSLSSAWRHLSPAVLLQDVAIGDDVRLGNLRVELDFLGTLTALEPRLRIDAGDVRLQLARDARGWFVASLPRGQAPLDLTRVLAWIDRLEVVLSDVEVVMNTDTTERSVRLARGGLFRDGTHMVADLDIVMEGAGGDGRLTLTGRFAGGLGAGGRLGGGLHLGLTNIDLPYLLPPGAQELLGPVPVGGDVWVAFRFGETRLTAEIQTGPVRNAGGEQVAGAMALAVSGRGIEGLWNAEIERGILPLTGGSLDLTGTRMVARDGVAAVALTPVEVAPLAGAVLAFRDVLPARAVQILSNGAPRGRIESAYVHGGGGHPLTVAGHVSGAHLIGDNAVPSFRNQSGFFSAGTSGGYIEVLSPGESELRFAAFDDYWKFDRARGHVAFEPIPGGGIIVSSGLLEVGLGELQARGRFHMNAFRDKAAQTWGLQLGVVNAELLEASTYLPRNLSPQFRAWLDDGIKGGHSAASGMLFHGSPAREAASETKTYELFFDVSALDLVYHPDWPRIDEVRALVYAGNWGARARKATGKMFSSRLDDVDVDVDVISIAGAVDRVRVDAQLQGPIDDGIRFINATPLAELTSRVTGTWFGTGPIAARGEVVVPLARQSSRETQADVTVHLKGNELVMPNYQLDARDLTTELTYSNNHGLGAVAYTAKLLDGPVSGSIESDVYGNRGEIRVMAEGQVAVSRLYRWSRQPILTQVSGELAYASTLHIPFGPGAMSPYVVVQSDLIGVASRLPSPMGKSVETPVDFRYQHTFEPRRDLIEWDYDHEVVGRLQVVDGAVLGGEVTFGVGHLLTNSVDSMVITGELDYADYEVWSELIDAMQIESPANLESGFAQALDNIEVSVARLDAFGLELTDAGIAITRSDDAWRVVVSNPKVDGVIRVPDADEEPLTVDLAYLRVDGEEDEDADPFEDIDPREYLPVNFSTRELRVGDDDYGSWQLAFRPDSEGAVLNDVRASVRGLQVVGNSTITWRPDEQGGSSTFQGTVRTDDLARALTEFGYASSIEGKGMQFGADIAWPGSPVMIEILRLTGEVAIESGEGRFVQVETGGTGALKLLGIFDFASLARRLAFDFSDIVKSGYSFDKVSGVVGFESGRVDIVDSIVIEGSGSIFKVGGSVELETETLDNDMIVTLPVSRNLPWYAAYSAIATGPLVGAGVYIAQKVFENQINAMSSAKYKVGGTIEQPEIEFVSIFNDTVREGATARPAGEAEAGIVLPDAPPPETVHAERAASVGG